MSARFVEGSDVFFEIETGDSTLGSHTGLTMWYIPPNADGSHGDPSTKLSVSGTAIAGESGNSVNQGASVNLIFGLYSFWSESNNPSGKHCVSPAFDVISEKRGTIRP